MEWRGAFGDSALDSTGGPTGETAISSPNTGLHNNMFRPKHVIWERLGTFLKHAKEKKKLDIIFF